MMGPELRAIMRPVTDAVDEIISSEPLPKGDSEETTAEVLERVLADLYEKLPHDDVVIAHTIATNQCIRMSFNPFFRKQVAEYKARKLAMSKANN